MVMPTAEDFALFDDLLDARDPLTVVFDGIAKFLTMLEELFWGTVELLARPTNWGPDAQLDMI